VLLFVAKFTKVNSEEPFVLLNPPIMSLLFFSLHFKEVRQKGEVEAIEVAGRLISGSFTV
jgi:hypothetical protein